MGLLSLVDARPVIDVVILILTGSTCELQDYPSNCWERMVTQVLLCD